MPSSRNLRRGATLVETAMLIPILLLLLVGMVDLARITYTYYTLRKTVYSIAMYVSNQQNVDFCDPADPAVAAAINFGLTGTTDGSQPVFVTGLTAAMILVTPEAYDPVAQTISTCSCGVPGCDTVNGGSSPSFITVSIPGGYTMPVIMPLPFAPIAPIPLSPSVKVPYGGT
jgi:hypothetical protein